ncbi:MAG: aminomethyl-transferring glycine dehydrogenase [Haliscomenobacter sp.]
MKPTKEMHASASYDQFVRRHIGPNATELVEMLESIGVPSLNQLIDETVPPAIRLSRPLNLPEPLTEYAYLQALRDIAGQNILAKNFIGMGYYGTITPSVIARNIFQNPGWYTQYTPYQAEIAQGRLEALLNFQTMVSDLTGLPVANASLLDEGTAAAEAMAMFYGLKNKKARQEPFHEFLVSDQVFPQTLDVLYTRAKPLGIEVRVLPVSEFVFSERTFGIMLPYPAANGAVTDYRALVQKANAEEVFVMVSTNLLSLALLSPPGEWGADAVVGNSQRFGVPMGYGGPHAAFFATKEEYKRVIPGRIIGVSVDVHGKKALRMALQTREQHIRREKATSNICTAQALLAIMAGMYAVYHGPDGIRAIAQSIHDKARLLDAGLKQLGYKQANTHYFDTLCIRVDAPHAEKIRAAAEQAHLNFYYSPDGVLISIDETTSLADIEALLQLFASLAGQANPAALPAMLPNQQLIPDVLRRESAYLTHPVFNSYHTESKMMRYIKRLENKDLSLTHSMIALGSCTMKLNAATELLPVSWPEFADLHPFAPLSQTKGYQRIFNELSDWLCEVTGFAACSLQPNSGAQGEYAGLLTIRAFHQAAGEGHRNIALIPSSAHGTNPASAVMAGMEVVVVNCDELGNIDVADLQAKAEKYSARLAALMVTYPSTHGVFEEPIREICAIIHAHGGKVYMDGANMNAQVGLTSPAIIGADVCHLNLHKTFAIPHGGGGPGVGPICVNESLQPFLPGHAVVPSAGASGVHAVSSAPWGSASILLISYGYIRMLGAAGLTDATRYAILNANYIKSRLESAFEVLYVGTKGRSAHELILDLRPFKALVSAEDVAKRLMDYGFHAPTLSFPVAGTIMIEPTESESKDELDRFCDALLQIRREIDEIASGEADVQDNVLHHAPHTAEQATADSWNHSYSREKAVYPLPYLREGFKFWPSVGRIDSAYGDRNLVCTCPPIASYQE